MGSRIWLAGAEADVDELPLSFRSVENQAGFLHLLGAHEATACEEEETAVPHLNEIRAAESIAKILPVDVIEYVPAVAALHRADNDSPQIQ